MGKKRPIVGERTDIRDLFKVSIVMDEKYFMFDRELSNTAIDWGMNGQPSASQFKVDSCSFRPSVGIYFKIFLPGEIVRKGVLLFFVFSSLKEL